MIKVQNIYCFFLFFKSNLHYICGITPKHATSGRAYLRGLPLGRHSFETTSEQWQAVGGTVSDVTDPTSELTGDSIKQEVMGLMQSIDATDHQTLLDHLPLGVNKISLLSFPKLFETTHIYRMTSSYD